MRLNYSIWPGNCSEWALFSVACNKSATLATSTPNNAVKNEYRCSVVLTFNHIPDLSHFPPTRIDLGKPTRNWRIDLGVKGVPPFWSWRTDVLETPSGGESAHTYCAKYVEDPEHANDQCQRDEHPNVFLQQCHGGYFDSFMISHRIRRAGRRQWRRRRLRRHHRITRRLRRCNRRARKMPLVPDRLR